MTYVGQSSRSTSQRLLNQFQRNNSQVSQSLERLSTGKRINQPKDDPAGFVAAEQLRGDIVVLEAEQKAEKSERFQVRQRESALSNIQNVLTSVRGSLVSAADGSLPASAKRAMQQEIDASLDAIDLIATRTEGVADSENLSALREGNSANVVNGDVAKATQLVEGQLGSISGQRAAIGAYEKYQIEVFSELRQDQIVINRETLSQIEDADFAAESAELMSGRILSDASIAALTYSQREQVEQLEELLESIEEGPPV